MRQNWYWWFYTCLLQSELGIIHNIMPHSPIKTTTTCAPVSHGEVLHKQLHERRLHLQALLIHDHQRNVDFQKETWNAADLYTVVVMVNSIVVGHIPRNISIAYSIFFAQKQKPCSLYNYQDKAMFNPSSHTWTRQSMELPHVNYIYWQIFPAIQYINEG